MRTLEKMHPAVCFLYLLTVLGFTAFAREPVTVLISLGGSVLLAAFSGGLNGAGWFGAVAVTGALANFLFVHNGETALFFVGDRAFTLEALCYGAFVGGMLAAVCLLVCLLAGCGSKEQTVTPDFVLTYADNQPADYPTTQGAERFAALVKERTGGKVVIQVKSGGEYGTEQEVWQQLSIGGIDFARLSLSVLAADLPKLNVLQLPCLYEDAAHMWRVLDGPIGEEFLRVFAERDMVGLSWYDAGARSFYSDKSLRSLEDLQGMTIRVQDANVVIDMVKLLGGDPVTLAYSDVYAAFETDKIDAAENNWPAYLAMEHYKVARYYLVDEHSRVPEIQLASGKTWAKLPDEYRSVLRECARESARYERELWTQQEAAARKTVLAAGCREIQLSDEEKERFRELVQPLYEKYAGPYLELVKKIQQG